MKQWKGEQVWEELRPLGEGGQSDVFLVRNGLRISQREGHFKTIGQLSGLNLKPEDAEKFAFAVHDTVRPERPRELGALKKYKPRAAEAQARQRLQQEIEVLGANNPGLPKLLDSNEADSWIVTEYFPNGTLEQHLLDYAGNAFASLGAFRGLVSTVANLHDANIVHRDIKPANVFVGHDGELVLGDFGIVFLPNQSERPTFTSESVGPRDYMPPWAETEDRFDDIACSFDVYELGKLLWCMAYGRLKLPREWFNRPRYDLTVKFPGDPGMHALNAIIGKCFHETASKCLPNAGKLLSLVDDRLAILRRGGQMLDDGIPRPCRVCGRGFYAVPEGKSPDKYKSLAMKSGTTQGSAVNPGSWIQDGVLYARPYTCDACGHIELFQTRSA